MSNTLQNTLIPLETWVDVYTLITIDAGVPIQVQNIGTTDLYYSISETEPAQDSDFYKIFSRGESVVFNSGDVNVWIFSPQANGLVNASRFYPFSNDFFLEVRKGNVAGHRLLGKVAEDGNTSTVFKDIWPVSVNMELRTDGIAETWEVVSSSDEDKAGGLGATEILVQYLDNNYIERSVPVTLNGEAAVQIAVDCYRPAVSVVTKIEAAGTLSNVGVLTISVVGSGAVRSVIPAINGVSADGHITVPANHSMFFMQVMTFLPKNIDGNVSTFTKGPFPTDPLRSNIDLPYYQNASKFDVRAYIPLAEKTDVIYRAKTSIAGQRVDIIREFILIHNDYL